MVLGFTAICYVLNMKLEEAIVIFWVHISEKNLIKFRLNYAWFLTVSCMP